MCDRWIAWLRERHAWAGLQSIIAVTATRELINKGTGETRYFISSLSANNPAKLEHAVRAHWAIENNLHWGLDIALMKIATGHAKATVQPILPLSDILL